MVLPADGLRYDALHDTWVIIAPDRGNRPCDQRMTAVKEPGRPCPFCPGSEDETPPAILSVERDGRLLAGVDPSVADGQASDRKGPPARPLWRVRVFPNRFAAVDGADGRHEVVVITPDHGQELADLGSGAITDVLAAVQTRVRALQADPAVAAVLFFLNSGAGAGASLAHAHGQILATPVVPSILRIELAACAAWMKERGTCLICDMAAGSPPEGLLIADDPRARLLAPRASRFAWEMMILPRGHQAAFESADRRQLSAVAGLLGVACRTLRAVLGRQAYNLVLHTAPAEVQDYHWHLELLPRLSPLAGFETGTGFFINPVRPEDAATTLRRAIPARNSTGNRPRKDSA